MATTPARPAVIRTDPLDGRNSWNDALRALPFWIISAAIHAVLVFFFWMTVGGPDVLAGNADRAREEINTRVERDEQQPAALTNVFEGLDPQVPQNFDTH